MLNFNIIFSKKKIISEQFNFMSNSDITETYFDEPDNKLATICGSTMQIIENETLNCRLKITKEKNRERAPIKNHK